VSAEDANGLLLADYSGTLHFTSSDFGVALPADSGLSNGIGNFSVTLKTAGSQTLTARDRATSGVFGTVAILVVGSANGIPRPDSVTPAALNNPTQQFTFLFEDSAGYQDLGVVNMLINNVLDGRQACYLAYSQPANMLFLVDDAGSGFAGANILGVATGAIQNSQCAIGWTSSAVTHPTSNQLALTLTLTLKTSFAGSKVIYMAARNVAESNSGWQALGVWQAAFTPAGTITIGSLSPARGAAPAGTLASYVLRLTDKKGASDMGVVNLLVNSSIDGRQGCYLAYSAASNSLLLIDDAGDAGGPYAGRLFVDGQGSIQNGYCILPAPGLRWKRTAIR
jgi:hypothetical protein